MSAHLLVRALFLRVLGAVFAVAFLSLWVQADGLFGASGIAPAQALMAWAHQNRSLALPSLPTLFWLSASDGALHLAFAFGLTASLSTVAGFAPRASLFACWALYLSFVCVGDVFLQFQWDMLLLEAGLLGVLFAPPGLKPSRAWREPVNPVGLWLLRWLLFRLMFLSGVVKLASRDITWRNLTAFEYHYWTQPLPAWTSYYAAKLPAWVQKLSAVGTFGIELALPFCIFLPRRFRQVAAAAFLALQLLIAATGNYGFFNLLTAALCIPLLDDALLARLPARLRGLLLPPEPATPPATRPLWNRRLRLGATVAFACVVAWVSVGELSERLGFVRETGWLRGALAPLRSINTYGLFAVMTTRRPEISLEGSEDGIRWEPYVFKWKPGPLDRRPTFMQPHMPRLDWQMWFAALGTCEQNPWFVKLLTRLFEGSAPVRALFEHVPFAERPPRYLRTTVAPYRFTSREEKAATGAWWARAGGSPYCPALAYENGQLLLLSNP